MLQVVVDCVDPGGRKIFYWNCLITNILANINLWPGPMDPVLQNKHLKRV